jgi:thiamine transport system ATP-binding protein
MCTDLRVRFDLTSALDDLDLTVRRGSIVAVMGPSGCGKSTLLRVIAGLQRPDDGMVTWDGVDLATVPPHRRQFGLMFQDYALFPHRNVAQNVAFGLRMAGWEHSQIEARVGEMLDLVGLAGYESRSVDRLSGGEQQRVALARTLAPRPRMVMLDEPLGSLDRALRDRLVAEMRDTFRQLNLTALYVTHDQDEAFSMGDEIAVMEAGRIVRQGSGAELWFEPGSASVARLIGHDNVLSPAAASRFGLPAGGGGAVVPASAIAVVADDNGVGIIDASILRGGDVRCEIVLDGLRLVSADGCPGSVGDPVSVKIDPTAVIRLPTAGPETEPPRR